MAYVKTSPVMDGWKYRVEGWGVTSSLTHPKHTAHPRPQQRKKVIHARDGETAERRAHGELERKPRWQQRKGRYSNRVQVWRG